MPWVLAANAAYLHQLSVGLAVNVSPGTAMTPRFLNTLDGVPHHRVVIEITEVKDVQKTGANTATMKLVGTCAIHGKTQPVSIPC